MDYKAQRDAWEARDNVLSKEEKRWRRPIGLWGIVACVFSVLAIGTVGFLGLFFGFGLDITWLKVVGVVIWGVIVCVVFAGIGITQYGP